LLGVREALLLGGQIAQEGGHLRGAFGSRDTAEDGSECHHCHGGA
jgi:hypothetical protein